MTNDIANEAPLAEEPEFFYYARDQQVPLELVDDSVAVAFSETIPERRLDELRARTQPVDILGQSPALLSRNVLVHRTGPAARGPERVRAFAERLNRGPSVRFVAHVFRNPANGLHLIPTDEISVRFQPGVTGAQIDALNAQHNVEIIEQKSYAPTQYLLRVLDPSPRRTFEVANAYHQSDLVEWAEPNFVMETRRRFQGFQWHLNNTGQNPTGQGPGVVGEDVEAQRAWAITQGSGNVVIAILDEGVDITHPGLRTNIAEGGRNYDDPTDPTNPNPVADDAHGTACAGVAAGAGGRISGVAPGCKILPIKMLQADNNATADAIHYAAHRAQVLSNSWGSSYSAVIEQAFLDVMASGREGKGTVVLFAVGNDNLSIPAGDQSRIDGVIAVGASTNVGSRSGYSNIGEDVDNPLAQKRISVLACSDGTSANQPFWQAVLTGPPATGPCEADNSTENIYTTDIQGNRGYNPLAAGAASIPEPGPVAADHDYTGLFGGTSSACPLAAGICALMLSVNADLTRAHVKYILEATADKIGTGQPHIGVPPTPHVPVGKEAHYVPATGHDPAFGFGRANAEWAVKVARGEALRQVVCDASGNGVHQDTIPVVLRRQNGTNRFVSDAVIELIDARRDPAAINPCDPAEHQPDRIYVRGGPGGFLRASYQPVGGGPTMSDEVEVQGEPT